MTVRFAEAGLPPSLQFLEAGAVRTLHDDGRGEDAARDGVYSAIVALEDAPLAPAPSAAAGLDPEKTLLVRHTAVVNNPSRTSDPCLSTNPADANKKWTFGYLMTQMANQPVTGRSPSDLAKSLLAHWERNTRANNDPIPARREILRQVTEKWLRASGSNGRLAMHKAPFRLLAIVNRVDLRQNLFFGEGLAGELRFVWGVLDLDSRAKDGSCVEIPNFTVIMEYAVDKADAAEVKAWGRRWADLDRLALDSAEYRNALQSITESVVRAGVGAPRGRANGSALARIRTNEIALAAPWQLREFSIARPPRQDAGLFFGVSVKQTPAGAHNGTALFAKYVEDHRAEILAGRHNVPLQFDGVNFRGGHSLNNIDFWSAPGIRSNAARHLVSLGTCNGCHGAETNTAFLHVFPRPRAEAAGLSGFLTGVDVSDPVEPATTRHFDDLQERAAGLAALTSSAALAQLGFKPTNRTH